MEQPKKSRETKKGRPWTFRDWYERNKMALAEKRRRRYESDDAYRQGIIERNRLYRKSLKNEDISMRVRRPKNIMINISGAVVDATVFNIGYLAYVVGKSPATVRAWEKNGLLPRTPFTVGGKSERVYTDAMVRAVKHVVDTRGGNVTKGDSLFYTEIISRWESLGIKVR